MAASIGALNSGQDVFTRPVTTISAWVYPTTENAAKVVYAEDSLGTGPILNIDITGTTLTFERIATGAPTAHFIYQQTIALNTWTHVGMRMANGNFVTAYVNGVNVSAQSYDYTGEPHGTVYFQQDMAGAMRYLWVSYTNTFTATELDRIRQDPQFGLGYSFFAPNVSFYPLLPGGTRLIGFGTRNTPLTVSGSVPEVSNISSPPYSWGSGLQDDREIAVPPPSPITVAGDSGGLNRRMLATLGARRKVR